MTTDQQQRLLASLVYLDTDGREQLRWMLDVLERRRGVSVFMQRVRRRLDVLEERERAA